ncbi:hypothetical protein Taro_023708 [Colocasia esculenta]|uniref:Uncharacterized protein n=1 Tax=Colocasia esculenta TaxID=4460 RepID=A0A843UY61_COLES|nr:hypothetical protein [Colocasia esculenta]
MTSAVEGQAVDQDVKCIIDCGDISKLIRKRVRLVDIEMQHVAEGILISTEIEKVVMGRKIGTEYCFEKPSAIQQRGIVLELDVIQQAQSGTRKTATFCSGILQQLNYMV